MPVFYFKLVFILVVFPTAWFSCLCQSTLFGFGSSQFSTSKWSFPPLISFNLLPLLRPWATLFQLPAFWFRFGDDSYPVLPFSSCTQFPYLILFFWIVIHWVRKSLPTTFRNSCFGFWVFNFLGPLYHVCILFIWHLVGLVDLPFLFHNWFLRSFLMIITLLLSILI